jgi:hypothetical protein
MNVFLKSRGHWQNAIFKFAFIGKVRTTENKPLRSYGRAYV